MAKRMLFWRTVAVGPIALGVFALASTSAADDVEEVDGRAAASVKVYVGTPLNTVQVDALKEQLTIGARQFCDATDGQVYWSDISFTNDPADRATADIIYHSFRGRPHADLGFGRAASKDCNGNDIANAVPRRQLFIYDDGYATGVGPQMGSTIAHEMGHLLLGLLDHYPDEVQNDLASQAGSAIVGAEVYRMPLLDEPVFRSMRRCSTESCPPWSGYERKGGCRSKDDAIRRT